LPVNVVAGGRCSRSQAGVEGDEHNAKGQSNTRLLEQNTRTEHKSLLACLAKSAPVARGEGFGT